MKKALVSIVMLGLLLAGIASQTYAATKVPKFYDSSKENQQIFGYYFMDQYQDEILNAVKSHYKGQEVGGIAYPWWMKHNMVSIAMQEKGVEFGYPYMFKITVLPNNKDGKSLGIDTIYLGVSSINGQSKDGPTVKLVKYEHKPPKKNNTSISTH